MPITNDIQSLEEVLFIAKSAAIKKKKNLLELQKQEIKLWSQWQHGGKKQEDLKPLLKSFRPFLETKVRSLNNPKVPTSAVRGEVNKLFIKALKTYKPEKNTKLSTWVGNTIRSGSRYIKTYQNIGKIPEPRIGLIRNYEDAIDSLTDKYGYKPDTKTIADHMKLPPREVERLETEISRKDLTSSRFIGDPIHNMAPKELEVINLVKYHPDLNTQERTVYEYTFGLGKPTLKTGEIAKKLGIRDSKVSRMKSKFKTLIEQSIDEI